MNDEILEISGQELKAVLSILPKDDLSKIALFIDILRVIDYWTVFKPILPEKGGLSNSEFEIIKLGLNLAFKYLFVPMATSGFPMRKSTKENRHFATTILYAFGVSVLLKKTHNLLKANYIRAEKINSKIVISKNEEITGLSLDNIEYFKKFQQDEIVNANIGGTYHKWNVNEFDNVLDVVNLSGAHLLKNSRKEISKYELSNIKVLVENLIYPYDTGYGIMMGYKSTDEIDNHFLVKSAEIASAWLNEVGLDKSVKFKNIDCNELFQIVTIITSLNIMHINYIMSAVKKYKEILIPQSLTMWHTDSDLTNLIQLYSNLEQAKVKRILKAISLVSHDLDNLEGDVTPLYPLLIDLGNGMLVRPVLSLLQNPFISTLSIVSWKDSNFSNIFYAPKEDIMRKDLYELFNGTRYKVIEGNIKIRNGNEIVTDIDAAILDVTTGELALFQIKWQNFHTSDVKKLRSRAKNFIHEIDSWAFKVEKWIDDNGIDELNKTLRIKVSKDNPISQVYLFGLSKTAARMNGYGYYLNSSKIAITNWSMFERLRGEVGPTKRVFHDLHTIIKKKENEKYRSIPVEVNIKTRNYTFEFKDLWSKPEIKTGL